MIDFNGCSLINFLSLHTCAHRVHKVFTVNFFITPYDLFIYDNEVTRPLASKPTARTTTAAAAELHGSDVRDQRELEVFQIQENCEREKHANMNSDTNCTSRLLAQESLKSNTCVFELLSILTASVEPTTQNGKSRSKSMSKSFAC